jgi:preprotein translocase subunit SecG
VIYILYVIHIFISLFLIGVVLLQRGKGADLSVFGGGATQAAFGARGGTHLLHRLTVAGFVLFILTTLGIGLLQSRRAPSIMSTVGVEEPAAAGAAAVPPAVDGAAEADDPAAVTPAPLPSSGDGATVEVTPVEEGVLP